MFDTFKVICKDAKHFEKAVCPMITSLKGLSYPLPPILDKDMTYPEWDKNMFELGHYLVMIPAKIVEEELTKLMLIDNLSQWTMLHRWKE